MSGVGRDSHNRSTPQGIHSLLFRGRPRHRFVGALLGPASLQGGTTTGQTRVGQCASSRSARWRSPLVGSEPRYSARWRSSLAGSESKRGARWRSSLVVSGQQSPRQRKPPASNPAVRRSAALPSAPSQLLLTPHASTRRSAEPSTERSATERLFRLDGRVALVTGSTRGMP